MAQGPTGNLTITSLPKAPAPSGNLTIKSTPSAAPAVQPTSGSTGGLSPSNTPQAQQINENLQTGKTNAADTVVQDVGEAARQTNAAINSPLSPLGWITGALGGLTNLAASGIKDVVDPAAKAVGTAARNVVGAKNANAIGQKVLGNKVVQGANKMLTSPSTGGDLAAVGQVANLAGTVVGAGQGAEAAGEIPNAPIVKSALAPFKGSYLPDVEQGFQDEGLKAPLSAMTKNKFVQATESLAEKTPFGGKITDTFSKATTDLANKTDDIVNSLKPLKSMSDENLGKSIQAGLKQYDDNFRATEDKVYDQFGKTYGKAPTLAAKTQGMLSQVIKEQGNDYYKGIDPSLSRMLDKMNGLNSSDAKALLNEGFTKDQILDQGLVKPPDLTFNELKATRTSIGEQLSRDPENTALKRLYGSLSGDMQDAVSKVDSKGSASLAKLNTDYASGKAKIESRVVQSISQSNPESIAQNLFKRNSADVINQVKEMVGPQKFGDVQTAFMRQVFDDANTRGSFDVAKLQKNLGSYDKETLDAILDPKQQQALNYGIDQLNKLKDLHDSLKPGQKFAAGSQTAYLQRAGVTIAQGSAFLQAVLTGNLHEAGALLLGLGSQYLGTKFLTSDVGRQFFTSGFGQEGNSASMFSGSPSQIAPGAGSIASEIVQKKGANQ